MSVNQSQVHIATVVHIQYSALRTNQSKKSQNTCEGAWWPGLYWYVSKAYAAIHCKLEVDISESLLPTSNLNASQCICFGKQGHPQQADVCELHKQLQRLI